MRRGGWRGRARRVGEPFRRFNACAPQRFGTICSGCTKEQHLALVRRRLHAHMQDARHQGRA